VQVGIQIIKNNYLVCSISHFKDRRRLSRKSGSGYLVWLSKNIPALKILQDMAHGRGKQSQKIHDI